MPYRIIITGTEPTADNTIRFHCLIETKASGDWLQLTGSPTYIEIKTGEILTILRRNIAKANQHQEILTLFNEHARSLPLLIADAAIPRLEALLPTGWPVTVNLSGLTHVLDPVTPAMVTDTPPGARGAVTIT